MQKKIIVLNGSPRKNGNTEAMVDAYIRGAEKAGHKVDKFNLGQMDVHPCIGCLRGGKDAAHPCTQKDEMDAIYPAYQQADLIVLASPMYYWGITAQLKGAIDRLFAVTELLGNTPKKQTVLLMAAEGDSDDNNAPVIAYYESLVHHLGWQDKGQLFIGGVYEKGDIEGNPGLLKAEEMGASL